MSNAPLTPQVKPPVKPPLPHQGLGSKGPSFGVDHNTEGGGVWQNTSSKQEKIVELKSELPHIYAPKSALPKDLDSLAAAFKRQLTLDEATDVVSEKLDLNLSDGCGLVFSSVDSRLDLMEGFSSRAVEISSQASEKFKKDTLQTEREFTAYVDANASIIEDEIIKVEARLAGLDKIVSLKRASEMGTLESAEIGRGKAFLRWVTEFARVEEKGKEEEKDLSDKEVEGLELQIEDFVPPAYEEFMDAKKSTNVSVPKATSDIFHGLCLYYRLLTARNALEEIKGKWEYIVTEADMDVDRRALENVAAPTKVIDKNQLDAVIKSILVEGSHERLKVWWELLDRDGDGMLEEEEMNKVVELYQSPIKSAINEFTVAAISNLPEDKVKKIGTKAHKKYLNKLLKRTMSRCYEIEQEAPHRLRCVYAWADKAHQDNKFSAVHVSDDISGRKRYVELLPKISYEEFIDVQKSQFEFLDKIGEGYMKSLREEMWVKQGLRRQNKELVWQCAGFFVVVSLIDGLTYIF